MLYRKCPRCGKSYPVTEKCECMVKREKERQEYRRVHYSEQQKEAFKKYNRFKRDKVKQNFYNSDAWKRTRATVLARAMGFDELEMNDGHIVPANTVHHIVPISVDMSRALDVTNLIALNRRTHKYVHTEYDASEERLKAMEEKLFSIVRRRERTGPRG